MIPRSKCFHGRLSVWPWWSGGSRCGSRKTRCKIRPTCPGIIEQTENSSIQLLDRKFFFDTWCTASSRSTVGTSKVTSFWEWVSLSNVSQSELIFQMSARTSRLSSNSRVFVAKDSIWSLTRSGHYHNFHLFLQSFDASPVAVSLSQSWVPTRL